VARTLSNKERRARYKQRQQRTTDFLDSRIQRGEPHRFHRLLARMARWT